MIVFLLIAWGLFEWFLYALETKWMSGGFSLVAVDGTMANMVLFGSSENVLIGPTIFAVGNNYTHIVLKQHPRTTGFEFDRSVTNYFVIGIDNKVRGPLTKEEFDALSASLSLPPFTKVFHELE